MITVEPVEIHPNRSQTGRFQTLEQGKVNEKVISISSHDFNTDNLSRFENEIARHLKDGFTVVLDCGKSPWFYLKHSSITNPIGNKKTRSLADLASSQALLDKISELTGKKINRREELRPVRGMVFFRSHLFVIFEP